ncbi:MAG: glycosyltransferase [Bacteroidales bacterium]|nr:glycosyltransferase [Bacteroidales bacterium]
MDQSDILIIGVIYNTYPETLRYLESIAPKPSDDIMLILVDNSDGVPSPEFLIRINDYHFVRYLETGKNLGYFGGAREGLKYFLREHPVCPKWILVTNVDIIFTPDFFIMLREVIDSNDLGIVAPAIISNRWNTDYNPQLLGRIPQWKLTIYRFLYSNFLIHNAFLAGAYLKKWLYGKFRKRDDDKAAPDQTGRSIYAPHGSCLVFHRNYFTRGGTLDIPQFLFGEEIMVAETALKLKLDIVYHPSLVIHDHEHASIGFFVTRKINRYYKESIKSILALYNGSVHGGI